MRIDVIEFQFWEARPAHASYSKSAPSVQLTRLLTVTVECVGDSTNKGEYAHFPTEEKMRALEEKCRVNNRKGEKTEMKVAAWQRGCDSVMPAGFIVSLPVPQGDH